MTFNLYEKAIVGPVAAEVNGHHADWEEDLET